MAKDILAIDFGTSNTYISRCPADRINTDSILLDTSAAGISTAILYSDAASADPTEFPVIGESATREYGVCDEREIAENAYRYYSHFKPDIVASPQARENTARFLECVARDAKKMHKDLRPLERRVIIGVPSEASPEYGQTLKTLAARAGFGEVELVDEPVAAMLNDISCGQFRLTDVMNGFLVIDFGGGTCDFAFLQNGEVRHSWGAMDLGGRLFDDLVYQWFCDQNPGQDAQLRARGLDFIVRTYHCRQVKENFSACLNKNRAKTVKFSVGHYGFIHGMNAAEFLHRAGSYTPSASFMDFARREHMEISPLLRGGGVDLIAWYREALLGGMRQKGIRPEDVRVVSLAGGSSQWFFVKDFCEEGLGKTPEQYRVVDDPYAAISKGLAMLPAIQKEFGVRKAELEKGKARFYRDEISPHVENSLRSCFGRIAERVYADLYLGKMKPALETFRQQGGTIAALEEQLAAAARAYEEQLREDVQRSMEEELNGLYTTSRAKLCQWMRTLNLHLDAAGETIRASAGDIHAPSIADPVNTDFFLDAVGTIVTLISASIIASICGGGGMALIAAGPLGLFIGFLIGGVATAMVLTLGKDAAQEWIKKTRVPGFVLRMILTDARLHQLGEDMKRALPEKIWMACRAEIDTIKEKLDAEIQRELECLSIVNVGFRGES